MLFYKVLPTIAIENLKYAELLLIEYSSFCAVEDSFFSFLRHHDWDILVMDALLHAPTQDEKQQTLRVSLMGGADPVGPRECKECRSPDSRDVEK